jgi:hypothetical protein
VAFSWVYCSVPVITMFTLKVVSEPAFEAAASLRVAQVLLPAGKLVVVGVHVMVRNDPAFDGVQGPWTVMVKVSAVFPVFLI